MRSLRLIFAVIVLWAPSGWCQEIVSFSWEPVGVAAPNTFISFVCVGQDGALTWQVGSSSRFNTSTGSFLVQRVFNGAQENSTLMVRAKADVNNTMVTCDVTSSSKVVNASTVITVATPPLPPAVEVHLRTDGEALEAVWHRPFTHNGFPITSYTLTVTNKTTGLQVGKDIVETGLDNDIQMYELRKPMVAEFTECHELTYSILASNAIGDSATSDVVISGFPIFPVTENVIFYMIARATMDNDTELVASFQSPPVCVYQAPPTFVINIYSSNRSLVRSTGTQSVQNMEPLTQHSLTLPGLIHGNNLSAELIITHPTVAGQVYFTYLGIDLPFDQDIDTAGLGGGAQATSSYSVAFTILLMLTICSVF